MIEVKTKSSTYSVEVGTELGGVLATALKPYLNKNRKVLALVDGKIPDQLISKFLSSISNSGFKELVIEKLPGGEKSKDLEVVESCYSVCSGLGLDRKSPILGIGGGATTDLAGFVAATYLRGVPYYQVPTSLLGMVDASIGGKTGINIAAGKNLVGAFKQPEIVISDISLLSSLPLDEIRFGLAECIKHAVMIGDDELAWLKTNISAILKRDVNALTELVQRNAFIKAKVVSADETEQDIRAFLNLGHTFGHAIEKVMGFGVIAHGQAVALGTIAAVKLSVQLGDSPQELLDVVKQLVEEAGLKSKMKLPSFIELNEATKLDKKTTAGVVKYVVPNQQEEPYKLSIRDGITAKALEEAWAEIS